MSRVTVFLIALCLLAVNFIARSGAEKQSVSTIADGKRDVTDVRKFGAIPDDGEPDTDAVMKAIAACKGSSTRTLYFPGGIFNLSNVTFPPQIDVEIANGALLDIESKATLHIQSPLIARRRQIFTGPGNVRFGTGAVTAVWPQWWGASPASSDSSPAINKAINSAPDLPGLKVRLTGKLNCKTTIHVNRHRVNLVGDGMYATQLLFNPDAPAALFRFAHPQNNPIVQCGIRDMGLLGAGAYPGRDRVRKIGIQIEDADVLDLRNVAIHNWGGNQSIGIRVQGRQLVHVENVTVLADLPILIDKNPRSDWISIDHSTFRNTYLLPMDPEGPSVKIASGVALHNVVFDGTNAWVGGKYGLYWKDSESKGVGINLTVKNVRMENAKAHGGAMIHIDHNYSLQNIVLENIYGCGGGAGGIYLRKCKNATLQNIYYTPVRGAAPEGYVPTALDIDESCANLAMINAFWNGGKISTGNLVKTFGTNSNPARYDNRVIEVYDPPSNGQGEGIAIYETKTWSHSGELADAEAMSIPLKSNTKVATLTVAASDGKNINESAQFMLGGGGKVTKIVGTKLTSETNIAGNLCLVRGQRLELVNRLGTKVDVVMTVAWR